MNVKDIDVGSNFTATLGHAPGVRQKAAFRLAQAAFRQTIALLKSQVHGLDLLAGIDDLSHRRDGGRVELGDVFTADDITHAAIDLETAALEYAEACLIDPRPEPEAEAEPDLTTPAG